MTFGAPYVCFLQLFAPWVSSIIIGSDDSVALCKVRLTFEFEGP